MNFSAAAERRSTCELLPLAAPAYRYLAEGGTTLFTQPPYRDDLVPTDYNLYYKNVGPFKCMLVPVSRVKEALKSALKRASEKRLQECFQQWKERSLKVAEGDHCLRRESSGWLL
jgi:hypothetical protein